MLLNTYYMSGPVLETHDKDPRSSQSSEGDTNKSYKRMNANMGLNSRKREVHHDCYFSFFPALNFKVYLHYSLLIYFHHVSNSYTYINAFQLPKNSVLYYYPTFLDKEK